MAPPLPTSGQAFDIRIKILCQGQLCYSNLNYYPGTNIANFTNSNLDAALLAFSNAMTGQLQAVLSEDAVIVDYLLTLRGAGAAGRTRTRVVNLPGIVASQSLPVWDTYSFVKIPQSVDQIPVGSDPFRAGRVGISGIPESLVDNGVVIDSALPELDDVAAVLLQFNITAPVATTMNLRIIDPAGTVPQRQVPVEAVNFNRIGTQLTRKV